MDSHGTLDSSCDFCLSQMQPTYATPISLSAEMGGASPAGGFVMEVMIVVMELMSCPLAAVCYHISATPYTKLKIFSFG